MEKEVCNFSMAWVGNCKELKPCPKHSQIKCSVCGSQATKECDHTAMLVCGFPLCNNCFAINLPPNPTEENWFGFGGHKHVKPLEGHTKGWDAHTNTIVCSCGWKFQLTGEWSDLEKWDLHYVEMLEKTNAKLSSNP